MKTKNTKNYLTYIVFALFLLLLLCVPTTASANSQPAAADSGLTEGLPGPESDGAAAISGEAEGAVAAEGNDEALISDDEEGSAEAGGSGEAAAGADADDAEDAGASDAEAVSVAEPEPELMAAAGAPAADGAVRLQESGDLFATLAEAAAAAESAGWSTFTLEVIADTAEVNNLLINSNVTVVAAGGAPSVTLPHNYSVSVQGGGLLTLGDGLAADTLTFVGALKVITGTVNIQDGVAFANTVIYSGVNADGAISGGHFAGDNIALSLEKGACISEISGGVFEGKNDALHLSDAGTIIDKISGGAFYQTDASITLHGHAVFVQNLSRIGEIAGGHFEAERNCALVVIRGAWVGEISGGEFVAKRVGSAGSPDTRNAAVWVEGEDTLTGIGTVSGGHFKGTNFGLIVIPYDEQAKINTISGGLFEGTVALQNDVYCLIGEITGGKFIGSQGMLNAGKIGYIGGNADILGKTSYGIYNYAGAEIAEIKGGTIVSAASHGIMNAGTIRLISGGTVSGMLSAINCTGLNSGELESISNGVFWGQGGVAISLAYKMTLEPGLNASIGLGRYWGKDGQIFNNEDLVEYPNGYAMSESTLPVAGISETEFKYLMLPGAVTVPYYTVLFVDWDGRLIKSEQVPHGGNASAPPDPQRSGYTFSGWEGSYTNVTADVTITAQYRRKGGGGHTTDPDPEPGPGPEPETEPEPTPEPERALPPGDQDDLTPGGDNYIELDDNGQPLGEWHWDNDTEMWVFDPYLPLGDLPQTGVPGIPLFRLALLGLSLAGMTVTRRLAARKQGNQPH